MLVALPQKGFGTEMQGGKELVLYLSQYGKGGTLNPFLLYFPRSWEWEDVQ